MPESAWAACCRSWFAGCSHLQFWGEATTTTLRRRCDSVVARPRGRTSLALVVAALLLAGGCPEGSGALRARSIRDAAVGAAGDVLVVTVEGCSLQPLAVSVEQTGEAVIVTARPVDVEDGDCVSAAQVELEVPLHGRRVVDGSTGRPVDTYRLPLIAAR